MCDFPLVHGVLTGIFQKAQKDLPIQLAVASKPLEATLILASFGSSTPFGKRVFDLDVKTDPALAPKALEKPLRYGKRPEIHHIFRPDPKNPPKVISLFFALAVIGTLPILLGTWAYLGANLSHATKAMGAAPISHSLFFGSIVSMEFVFFLYYSTWNLFQTLPVAGVIGLVAYISGSKALSEVQSRRLAGER
ncbi:Oligosaccharyltransferase subunit Ribophorin II-domain-containing protein [Xylogone sp. PMI_703]|nr:Oligosaccharyltransferase subunit Ribophorin II-domain-containing protein [Xylogone sp. PMI_703]